MSFVTGNGSEGGFASSSDVDNGKTSLTTPALDLGGMSEPAVSYWRWFFTGSGAPDHFVVDISPDNGVTWVNVESLTVSTPGWEEVEYRVRDYIAPTSAVRLRFVVADLGADTWSVEGLVDDFAAYDLGAALVPVGSPPTAGFSFSPPVPNPASGVQRLSLILPAAGDVEVAVLDLSGRQLCLLHRGFASAGTLPLLWEGRDQRGREVQAGVYWARAKSALGEATRKLVRTR